LEQQLLETLRQLLHIPLGQLGLAELHTQQFQVLEASLELVVRQLL
jgi:hypothetical protein